MPHRRQLRIAAIQLLFQLDVQGDDFRTELDCFLDSQDLSDADRAVVRALIDACLARRERIDELIVSASQHWDLQRITPIDRAILRLGVCEMLFVASTPPKVAMNEAIELAKVFGGRDSPQFVNGMLDGIWSQHKASEAAAEQDKDA